MTELKYFLLKTKFENQGDKKDDTDFFELVKNKLNWKEYLSILSELENKDFFKYNEKHHLSEYGLSILQEWESFFTQKEKDEKAERFKLHNESILSGWKRKTFWYIFAFGLFGGIYSGIDLFKKITSNKEVPKKQVTKQEMEEELSKLRTLVLTQKKIDSLNHSNSELNK
ncbi:hypothetical protein [uncultured Polaribacter sp.]|uniref:hypothetical protein n=1 Tax=uncultured Polaribacter sp. TaxID=174711 RepID=UPI0026317F70|nr:hypothetical protein [uncultured Polaribacter sp.]